jgi:hypothetical protein
MLCFSPRFFLAVVQRWRRRWRRRAVVVVAVEEFWLSVFK